MIKLLNASISDTHLTKRRPDQSKESTHSLIEKQAENLVSISPINKHTLVRGIGKIQTTLEPTKLRKSLQI